MKYRDFGNTGVKVSALGFGMMRLPLENGEQGSFQTKGIEVDEQASIAMLRHAIDNGVNYVDTAYTYANEKSEIITGKALQEGYRQKVSLATKFPVWLMKNEEDFERILDEQLAKLQTDTIDFYLLHALDKNTWTNKVLHFNLINKMEQAKAAGKIKHIGFSFHDELSLFKKIIDYYDGWEFCQIQLNYLDTNFQAGLEGLRYAAAKGLGVIIMEPLRGGYLANVPNDIQNILANEKIQKSPVQWAFDYLWDMSEVSLLLSGMGFVDEVNANISYAGESSIGKFKEEDRAVITKLQNQFKQYPVIGCTKCNYCMHCPQKVAIPHNFEAYNEYKINGNLKKAKQIYQTYVVENGAQAEKCVGCKQCEALCPQHIPISSLMPKIAALFE